MKFNHNHIVFAQAALGGFATLYLLENVLGLNIFHHAAAAAGCNDGAPNCSCTAFVDKGNSPGWYTAGANTASGSGWGGAAGHHHCDWKSPCCFCTDVKKCIKSGTPPTRPGSCRPDWGTAGYVDAGGPYPKTADFSVCPPGTGPPGDNT